MLFYLWIRAKRRCRQGLLWAREECYTNGLVSGRLTISQLRTSIIYNCRYDGIALGRYLQYSVQIRRYRLSILCRKPIFHQSVLGLHFAGSLDSLTSSTNWKTDVHFHPRLGQLRGLCLRALQVHLHAAVPLISNRRLMTNRLLRTGYHTRARSETETSVFLKCVPLLPSIGRLYSDLPS
jgi:hypothetical protein